MIERLYPGVFLTEVPFSAKPIEGVSTSTAGRIGPDAAEIQKPAPTTEAPGAGALHPSVYLQELPSSAKSIEGVATSTAGLAGASAGRVPAHTPEWTNFNDSDPGITLAQLHAWLSESSLYGVNHLNPRAHHALAGSGVVSGLAVAGGDETKVSVKPGWALAPDGRPLHAEIASERRVIDPDDL